MQDSNAVLLCAEGTDAGREAALDPSDRFKSHVSYSARVYPCTLNYIEPRKRVYCIAQDELSNQGPGLCKWWLKSYGRLDYDDVTNKS